MTALLLCLLLAAATFEVLLGDESSGKSSDVKYNGPVVYSNLPPPVLYFPSFPPKPKISNRGSDGDKQDKRIEYVPFPYKDLPLLVYQSNKQPPVHVVEKNPSQESTQDEQTGEKAEESTVTITTSPAVSAVYHQQDYGQSQQQYKSVQSFSSLVDQGVQNNQYAEASLPSNQQILTDLNPQNQQFVSIGISTIQTDLPNNDALIQGGKDIQQPASQYQQQNDGNQIKYVAHQASDDQHMIIQIPYPVQNLIQNSDQNAATTLDYSTNQNILQQYQPVQTFNSQQYSQQYSQQPTTSEATGTQQLSPQLQQQIAYMIQQNIKQQQQQDSLSQQQSATSYQNEPSINYQQVQQAYTQTEESQPFQHVGITIIQQPETPSVSTGKQRYNDVSQKQEIPQQQQQYAQPQVQDTSEGNYDLNNQQFVSIGVYPLNLPGGGNTQGAQQYYNLMAPSQNNQQQYLNIAEEKPLPENINYANIQSMGQSMSYANHKQMVQNMNYGVDLEQNVNSARHKPILTETTVIKNDLSGNSQSNPGYQVISIDLTGLAKPNQEQPRNVAPNSNPPNIVKEVRNPTGYPMNYQQDQRYTSNLNPTYQQEQRYTQNVNQQQEQKYTPSVNPTPQQEQRYPNPNPSNNNYNSQTETKFPQIFIQIPHSILPQNQPPPAVSDQATRPYTGTAQTGNLYRGPNKTPDANNIAPFHSGIRHQQYDPSVNFQHKEPVRVPHVRGNFMGGPRYNGNAQIGNSDGRGRVRPFASNLEPQRQYPNRPPNNNQRGPPPVRSHANFPPQGQSQQNNRRPNRNPHFNRGRDMSKMPSNINQDVRKKQQGFGNYRSKPVVPHLGGHPGLYASGSHQRFTSVRPPPVAQRPNRSMKKDAPRKSSASNSHPEFSSNSAEAEHTSSTTMTESTVPSFNFKHKNQFFMSDNITNLLDDVNFDEINQYISSGHDMFGSNSLGQGKKKLEDETFDKLIHKITKDAITNDPLLEYAVAAHPHELMNPSPVLLPSPAMPVAPVPMPVPSMPLPPPYGYYPQQPFGNPAVPQPMHMNPMMGNYPRLRRPLLGRHRNKFRRPGLTGVGFGGIQGPEQQRGLMGRLASRVSQLRLKPQIARREVEDFSADNIKDSELVASPRSTILMTEYGLDGITIPINNAYKFSDRRSVDEESSKSGVQPPILVYKGTKSPVEVYGNKDDIEKSSGETNAKSNETMETSSSNNHQKSSKLVNLGESFSEHDLEYLDVMYSILPDFIRDAILKRSESETSRWLPVDIPKGASQDTAGSSENKNISVPISPIKSLQNSSKEINGEAYSALEADIQELLTLLNIEEQSDLLSRL